MTSRDARSIAVAISMTLCLGAAGPLYAGSHEPLIRPWSYVQQLVSEFGDLLGDALARVALQATADGDTTVADDQTGDGLGDEGEVGGDIEPNG